MARGECAQQGMEQLLDQKQQPDAVALGVVENYRLARRFHWRVRRQRRPQFAGSHAVETMSFLAETLAQPARRQGQQRADGGDAELEQRIAKLGLDIQTVERHGAGRLPFFSGVAKDGDPRFGFGDRIAAEAAETDGEIGIESLGAEILLYDAGPLFGRSIETLQAAAVQPKDARLLRRRLDLGSKAQQPLGQFAKRFFTLSRRHFAGAQRRREGKRRGVAQTGQHALPARAFIDPQH